MFCFYLSNTEFLPEGIHAKFVTEHKHQRLPPPKTWFLFWLPAALDLQELAGCNFYSNELLILCPNDVSSFTYDCSGEAKTPRRTQKQLVHSATGNVQECSCGETKIIFRNIEQQAMYEIQNKLFKNNHLQANWCVVIFGQDNKKENCARWWQKWLPQVCWSL